MVGTRWNVFDILGRVAEQYKDNPRYRFRVMPAINENGESNFVYDYGVGFTTEYYNDMRESMSHHSRVRGLKFWCKHTDWTWAKSHPSRVRGLKSNGMLPGPEGKHVAPFAGVGIEIRRHAYRLDLG